MTGKYSIRQDTISPEVIEDNIETPIYVDIDDEAKGKWVEFE